VQELELALAQEQGCLDDLCRYSFFLSVWLNL
jgi:hypothetical protein